MEKAVVGEYVAEPVEVAVKQKSIRLKTKYEDEVEEVMVEIVLMEKWKRSKRCKITKCE